MPNQILDDYKSKRKINKGTITSTDIPFIKKKAEKVAKEVMGSNASEYEIDAYRHAYASAQLSRLLGKGISERAGNITELTRDEQNTGEGQSKAGVDAAFELAVDHTLKRAEKAAHKSGVIPDELMDAIEKEREKKYSTGNNPVDELKQDLVNNKHGRDKAATLKGLDDDAFEKALREQLKADIENGSLITNPKDPKINEKFQSQKEEIGKTTTGKMLLDRIEKKEKAEQQPTTLEKPTQTFEKAPNDKSSTNTFGNKLGDFGKNLGMAGLSFLNKIEKVSDTLHDSIMKQPEDLTKQERDGLMASPLYYNRKSPLFNAVHNVVGKSFQHQYPGKSKGYHNIKETNPLNTHPQPIKDIFGSSIEPYYATAKEKLAGKVDEVGEVAAVKDFQTKLNDLSSYNKDLPVVLTTVPRQSWEPRKRPEIEEALEKNKNNDNIYPSNPAKPQVLYPELGPSLKVDGIFGPKTNNRLKENLVKFGSGLVGRIF